jgi:uncharacterized protein (TIGR03083 family)
METSQHIAALRREGDLLAVAAGQAGLDAAVPSCPPWQVRDLLRHTGYIHRWAAGYISGRSGPGRDGASEAEVLSSGPPDGELIAWFRDGHAALLRTFAEADPDVIAWTVLPGPSRLASWARRQAHETGIHRADAELASGPVTPYPASFAADGIDELIMGFMARDEARLSPEQRSGPRRVLAVRAADTSGSWVVELTAGGRDAARVARGDGPADCTLAGPASGLYQLLWNRCDLAGSGAEVTGDATLLADWSEGVRVTWS